MMIYFILLGLQRANEKSKLSVYVRQLIRFA